MRSTIPLLLTAMALGTVGVGTMGCRDSETTATTASSSSSAAANGGGGAGGSTSASGGAGGAGQGGAGGDGTGGGGEGGSGGMVARGDESCGIGTIPGGGGPTGRVRVVAANLSSGNFQSYDDGYGIRILQGLDADVILMQEMNYGSNAPAAIDTLVDDVCDPPCNYIRGPQAQIPNGVLSRLPILECGSWTDPEVSNRNFVWARLDTPGEADLWAISVHLLSSSASKRALEATALLNHIMAAIPPSDMIVLGGDLNTNSRTETAIVNLSTLFETSGPYPVDQNNNGMTNAPRNEPYDWVLADAELSIHEIPVDIGQNTFPAGVVIDTRVYTPITDLAPALVSDSAAPSMQHMAVVKDFQLNPPPELPQIQAESVFRARSARTGRLSEPRRDELGGPDAPRAETHSPPRGVTFGQAFKSRRATASSASMKSTRVSIGAIRSSSVKPIFVASCLASISMS